MEGALIPNKVVLTFCQSCEEQIGHRFSAGATNVCTKGCQWDGSTDRTRPIIVVTYWRREMQPTPELPAIRTVIHGAKVKVPLDG